MEILSVVLHAENDFQPKPILTRSEICCLRRFDPRVVSTRVAGSPASRQSVREGRLRRFYYSASSTKIAGIGAFERTMFPVRVQ